jgi:hypothetical protein
MVSQPDGGEMGTHDTMRRPEVSPAGVGPEFEQFVRDTEPRLSRAFGRSANSWNGGFTA